MCVCVCACVCVHVRVYVIDGRVCFKSLRTVVVVGGCEFIFGYKPLADVWIDVWLHHDQVVIEPCN